MTVVARERAEQVPTDESGFEASPVTPGLTSYSLDRRYRWLRQKK